jgi:hypothetical protein
MSQAGNDLRNPGRTGARGVLDDLRDLAEQWRRMANDAARCERLAPKWGGESVKTKQP